jgi:hypothetical protein
MDGILGRRSIENYVHWTKEITFALDVRNRPGALVRRSPELGLPLGQWARLSTLDRALGVAVVLHDRNGRG